MYNQYIIIALYVR